MKISTEHFNQIKQAFILNKDKINKHLEFLQSPENSRPPKDLNKRLRWDCLYSFLGTRWICDNIYSYANDEHLDTALSKAMKEIN